MPGCGEPPLWCERGRSTLAGGGNALCGFGWGSAGVQPWRPRDFAGDDGLLDLIAREGATFPNADIYSGYNEIIVSNDAWVDALPASVEALFVIEGREGEWEAVRDVHRRYLEVYGLASERHPLLVLRPENWEEPFAEAG